MRMLETNFLPCMCIFILYMWISSLSLIKHEFTLFHPKSNEDDEEEPLIFISNEILVVWFIESFLKERLSIHSTLITVFRKAS